MASNNTPKNAPRLSARDQAAAMREAQLKQDKRKRLIAIVILVAALAALAGAIWFINKQGEAKPLAETSAPKNTRDDGGIPFGKDRVAGTDNGADAVELAVYLDFQCSYCATFELTNSDAINTMLTDGDITLVMHPVSILGTQFSADGANAAAYLAQESPEHVLDWINAVFHTDPTTNGAPSNDQMKGLATQVGVDEKVANKMFDGQWKKWVQAATNHAVNDTNLHNADGGFGTPTIMVNGKRLGEQYNWTVEGQLEKAIQDAKSAK